MKVIPNSTFYSEYRGKHPKGQLFFNPDNTVTLFEAEDQDVRDWVYENGADIKERRQIINAEAAASIRSFLESEKTQEEKEAQIEEEIKKADQEESNQKIQTLVEEIVAARMGDMKSPEPAPAAESKEWVNEVRSIVEDAENINMKVLSKAFLALLDKLED